MKNNSKRGFTIVELIIVIAVIGILAAVLIPTFSELIKQAQTANDTALVTNLNKALALDPTATYDTMYEALTSVRENGGYDVAKINATNSDNEILWDGVNKCFVYKDGDEIKYIPDTQKTVIAKGEEYKFWQICNENNPISEVSEQTYSVYWSGSNRDFVSVAVGFDAGNAEVSTVNYVRENATSARSVIIRTNNGTLNVNAVKDDLKHYGVVEELNIVAVNIDRGYSEFGTVVELKSIENGKFVAEKTAKFVQSKTEIEEILNGTQSTISKNVKFEQMSPIAKVVSASDFVSAVKNGGHYTIAEDAKISTTIEIVENTETIIDLKGHKIEQGADAYTIVVKQGAKLTIVNGDFSNPSVTGASLIVNKGELVIENGNYVSYGASVIKNEPNAELTINGGNFVYTHDPDYSGNTFPAAIINYANVTINGGVIDTGANIALNNANNGDDVYTSVVNITGGTFGGAQNSVYRDFEDTVAISGGVFNSSVMATSISGGTFNGMVTCPIISNGLFGVDSDVRISDGNGGDESVSGGRFLGKIKITANVTVSGGEFSAKTNFSSAQLPAGVVVVYDLENDTAKITKDVPSSRITAIFEDKVKGVVYYYLGSGGADKAITECLFTPTDSNKSMQEIFDSATRIVTIYENVTVQRKLAAKTYGLIVIAGNESVAVTNIGTSPAKYNIVCDTTVKTSDGKTVAIYYLTDK